jgi:hypothetical protein
MTKPSRSTGLNRRQLLWAGAALGSSTLLMSRTASADTCELPTGMQLGWRYCRRCKGFHYNPAKGRVGACPAGLGGHDGSASFNYWLYHGYCPNPVEQNGWRWCRNCQGLAYGTSPAGRCPAGGTHNHGDSFNYLLFHRYGATDNPQWGWWWCRNCQGLHYGPTASHGFGWCPAGGRHVALDSFPYLIYWVADPP